MKTILLQSAHRATPATDVVNEALVLLADLGAEIVDRCQPQCEVCGPVLDAAA